MNCKFLENFFSVLNFPKENIYNQPNLSGGKKRISWIFPFVHTNRTMNFLWQKTELCFIHILRGRQKCEIHLCHYFPLHSQFVIFPKPGYFFIKLLVDFFLSGDLRSGFSLDQKKKVGFPFSNRGSWQLIQHTALREWVERN